MSISKRDLEGAERLIGADKARGAAGHMNKTTSNLKGVLRKLEPLLGIDTPFAKGGVKMKKGKPPKKLRGRRR